MTKENFKEKESGENSEIIQNDFGVSTKKMPLYKHLEELRLRLFIALICWALCSIIGWFWAKAIISYFKTYPHLQNITLILIKPTDAFTVRFKLALSVGFMLALPIILYQIFAFIIPGLKTVEKKWIFHFIPPAVLLFYAGAAFSLYFIFPVTLDFLLIKMTDGIATPQISLESYVNFLTSIVLMGGLVFESPIILFFLTFIGILSSKTLQKGRKYTIVLIFIIAALATPPDIFSQILMAIPMLILYEICIWAAKAAGK